MLTITGRSTTLCDGVSRRSFLKIGGLSMGAAGGVGLADLLRAEAASGNTPAPHKAVINIFLGGGPPHQDLWEIKTDAPREIRGEFSAIPTSVPGIEICEVFPKLAGLMQHCAVIRSVVGCSGDHDAFQCQTGWERRNITSVGGRPAIGSVLGKMFGPVDPAVPGCVALADRTSHGPWSEPGSAGFLGAAFKPFKPQGEGMADLRLNGITTDRLSDRKALLRGLDTIKREVDASGSMHGMDAFSEAAFGVLTSSKLIDALDLSKEDPAVRARYGDGKPFKFQYDGAPTVNEHLLMARRLVEIGVRSVTISYGRWDSHGDNFGLVRDHGSKLDQCLSALIEDLLQRGMLNNVTILVWGEFGRTPRVNPQGGRDHWPQVSCAFMAGGGMKTGQAIGATNRLGEYALERPVHMQEVIATVYRNLGIDTASATLRDPTGRPQYLVEHPPIRELV